MNFRNLVFVKDIFLQKLGLKRYCGQRLDCQNMNSSEVIYNDLGVNDELFTDTQSDHEVEDSSSSVCASRSVAADGNIKGHGDYNSSEVQPMTSITENEVHDCSFESMGDKRTSSSLHKSGNEEFLKHWPIRSPEKEELSSLTNSQPQRQRSFGDINVNEMSVAPLVDYSSASHEMSESSEAEESLNQTNFGEITVVLNSQADFKASDFSILKGLSNNAVCSKVGRSDFKPQVTTNDQVGIIDSIFEDASDSENDSMPAEILGNHREIGESSQKLDHPSSMEKLNEVVPIATSSTSQISTSASGLNAISEGVDTPIEKLLFLYNRSAIQRNKASSNQKKLSFLLQSSSNLDNNDETSVKIPRNTFLTEPKKEESYPKLVLSPLVYGHLVVLGYNGRSPSIPHLSNKIVLRRRSRANAVIPSLRQSVFRKHTDSSSVMSKKCSTASYVIDENRSVVVEFDKDDTCDQFQVGRMTQCSKIDFTVTSTKEDCCPLYVSRFACRISIERKHPQNARLYAAGFDEGGNIFLGEYAKKFILEDKKMDGFTTNGIFVLHPGEGQQWGKVSVNGKVFKVTQDGTKEILEEGSNLLKDGSLIDLFGVTLLWRTKDEIEHILTKDALAQSVQKLELMCPVTYNKLKIPLASCVPMESGIKPYVYVACGHVQSSHGWGQVACDLWSCPMCRTKGPMSRLVVGLEPAFCVDSENPTHAFVPCGHMASESTVKYWASVKYPSCHPDIQDSPRCPFCMKLLDNSRPYVKLLFEERFIAELESDLSGPNID